MRATSLDTQKDWTPEPFIPRDVHERLDDAFDGELRLRWSLREGLWHVEQRLPKSQLGRAVKQLKRPDPWFDELVRLRDGYNLVMRVSNGDRVPCPECGLTIKMSIMCSEERRCPHCHRGRVAAGYYPLGWPLIEYLKSIDTQRTGTARVESADAANAAWQAAMKRAADEERRYGIRDVLMDQLNMQAGIPGHMNKEWLRDQLRAYS